MNYALVFRTTHQTMMAEEVLSLNSYYFDTLPLPKEIKTGCTIALSIQKEDCPLIIALLKNENIVVEGVYEVDATGWKKIDHVHKADRRIYLDNNASTPVSHEVVHALLPYLEEHFGNPSSIHLIGREARIAIDEARDEVAGLFGAESEEIVFTGSGTEANNCAIKGVCDLHAESKGHIITTAIEHPSVLEPCRYLEKYGYEVTYLPVDEFGLVSVDQVNDAIKKNTILITVQWANNEIGTLQPIIEIGALALEQGIVFHTDAIQVIGKIPFNVHALPIDLLSFSAHKFYGPKGCGGLYIRRNINILPIIHGGKQERGMRAGTENSIGIVGVGAAAMLLKESQIEDITETKRLRDLLYEGIVSSLEGVKVNGDPEKLLPNTLNISFKGVDGESLLINLDLEGINVSTGSACASGSSEPSYVLKALGVSSEYINGGIRFSLGKENTEDDITYTIEKTKEIVNRLRKKS